MNVFFDWDPVEGMVDRGDVIMGSGVWTVLILYLCFMFLGLDPAKDPCLKIKCSRHKVCVAEDYKTASCVSQRRVRWEYTLAYVPQICCQMLPWWSGKWNSGLGANEISLLLPQSFLLPCFFFLLTYSGSLINNNTSGVAFFCFPAGLLVAWLSCDCRVTLLFSPITPLLAAPCNGHKVLPSDMNGLFYVCAYLRVSVWDTADWTWDSNAILTSFPILSNNTMTTTQCQQIRN